MKLSILYFLSICLILHADAESNSAHRAVSGGKKAKRSWVITGATGRTGRLLYNVMKTDPSLSVRALVRNATKAKEKLNCGACSKAEGVFVGDITKLSTMEDAFKGVNGM